MTEPSPARPIPGPPSPGPQAEAAPFDELAELPVAEHVAVFEAEHARLQRELSTIDQL